MNNENHARSYGVETRTGQDEWITTLSPFLKFSTNIKGKTLRANYEFDSERPSAASIVPSFNILNPTRISAGNIYLKPSTKHDWSFITMGNMKKLGVRFYLSYYGSLVTDDKVSAIWFDDNSIRYSIPVNSRKPGYRNDFSLSLNRKLDKKGRWFANFYGDLMQERMVSYQSAGRLAGINPDNMDYGSFMSSFWGDEHGDRFYSGASGFHESRTDGLFYSATLNVRYSGDSFSARLNGGMNSDRTRYSFDSAANLNTKHWYVAAGAEYSAPFGMEMRTWLGCVS